MNIKLSKPYIIEGKIFPKGSTVLIERENERYRILGLTDVTETCDICGRTDLHRCYAVLDKQSNDVLYTGTSCGKTITGMTDREWERQAIEAEEDRYKAERRSDEVRNIEGFDTKREANLAYSSATAGSHDVMMGRGRGPTILLGRNGKYFRVSEEDSRLPLFFEEGWEVLSTASGGPIA